MRIHTVSDSRHQPGQALPAARRDNLVARDVDDELVVYDEERHHLHRMNHVAAAIWHLCDGRRSLQTVTLMAGAMVNESLDERSVRMALTTLETAGLLDSPLPPDVRIATMDRRRFLKRSAIGAGALPVIVSMSAPTAAAAASGCVTGGQPCIFDSDCCNGQPCNKEGRNPIEGTCGKW